MNANDRMTGVVAALREATGEEKIALEEDGSIAFGLDEDMGARIFPVVDEDGDEAEDAALGLAAVIVVGRVEPTDARSMFDLLAANYLAVGSGGGAFAIDKETGLLVLQHLFTLKTDDDQEAFIDEFAHLVGAARAFNARIKSQAKASGADVVNGIKI